MQRTNCSHFRNMNDIIPILVLLIALEHVYFLVLEMFLWLQPKTRKIFGIRTEALARETKVLAANQGLYNGFLAGGLLASVFFEDQRMTILFLSFVLVAGVYGAYSTKKIRLFYVQGLPALLTLILLLVSR